jgi:hypothetical protein
MDQAHIKFCPECGADGVVTKEVTPNHIIELYCPHCGILTLLLWQDHALIGTAASHDPDSDAEAW